MCLPSEPIRLRDDDVLRYIGSIYLPDVPALVNERAGPPSPSRCSTWGRRGMKMDPYGSPGGVPPVQQTIRVSNEITQQLRMLATVTGIDEEEHLRRAV